MLVFACSVGWETLFAGLRLTLQHTIVPISEPSRFYVFVLVLKPNCQGLTNTSLHKFTSRSGQKKKTEKED